MKKYAMFVGFPLFLTACVPNVSPQSYSVGSVGQVNRSIAAKVISVREIDIQGTNSGSGAAVGAGLGAVGGSGLGGSVRGGIASTIAGGVIGGAAGAIIESTASAQKGLEYVVDTTNGNLMTVVQGTDPYFPVGTKVLVLYGAPSRLIADPR
jgi:outer membrane lipoprotein SlyB